MPNGLTVHGILVDQQSRCIHWHSPLDVIALKFKCCNRFYACHSCHQGLSGHQPKKFNLQDEASQKVILCGVCLEELTFQEYLKDLSCPKCNSSFNPGCKLHYDLYFDNAGSTPGFNREYE